MDKHTHTHTCTNYILDDIRNTNKQTMLPRCCSVVRRLVSSVVVVGTVVGVLENAIECLHGGHRDSRARAEDSGRAGLVEEVIVLRWDHTAHNHLDVTVVNKD